MKQSNIMKLKVLKLVNEGFNNVEISKQTGVSQKGIGIWIKKWTKADKQKNDSIISIWCKIKELSSLQNVDSDKILKLSQSIEILQKQLLLNSKYTNL